TRPYLRERGRPPQGPQGRQGRGRSGQLPQGQDHRVGPVHQPLRGPRERDFSGRGPGPSRSRAGRLETRSGREGAPPERSPILIRRPNPMSDKPPESPHRLRSALDRVLVHDIKNMGFRLQMLLSNIDEHYGDPEFKSSVEELLRTTVERLDGMVERVSAH